MKIRKVSARLEKKVINWFDYLWTNKESVDDEDCMLSLPDKLRYVQSTAAASLSINIY